MAAQTLQPLSGLTCVLISLSKVIYVYATSRLRHIEKCATVIGSEGLVRCLIHLILTSEYSPPSHWVPVLLPRRSKYLFTLHLRGHYQPPPRALRFAQGRDEQLVIKRNGPWEGYRRQAKRRLSRCLLPAVLCARIFIERERERRVGTRPGQYD